MSAIIRTGDLLTPHGDTIIKTEDILYTLLSKKKS
nr:hypothetical protein [Alkalihalobacillus deserti]